VAPPTTAGSASVDVQNASVTSHTQAPLPFTIVHKLRPAQAAQRNYATTLREQDAFIPLQTRLQATLDTHVQLLACDKGLVCLSPPTPATINHFSTQQLSPHAAVKMDSFMLQDDGVRDRIRQAEEFLDPSKTLLRSTRITHIPLTISF
jgi:hypothetical protein